MARKIKKDDMVIVISGKDKGKSGPVIRVISKDNKVVVQGINLIKKHKRGNPNTGQEGGIVELEAPIHVSNVALIDPADPKAKKPTRIGFKILADGKKVRYAKRSGEVIDVNK